MRWLTIWNGGKVLCLNSADQDTLEAEQVIEKAAREVEEVEEEDLEMLDTPPVLQRYKSLLDCCITPEESALLQSRLRQKHWLSLRVRFEYVWRRIIEANSYASPKEKALPKEIHRIAVELVHSIILLGIHFKEYEYAWYWPERSGLTSDMEILVDLIKCCKKAVNGPQPEVWTARGWVLYKEILEMKQHDIIGSEHYISFMEQVIATKLVYKIYLCN
jgi:hypothetical protein